MRIIGAVLFAGAIGCAIAASILASDITEEINKLSPPDEQESPLFSYPGKLARIKREYEQLYPSGLGVRTLNRLSWAAIGLFVGGDLLMFAPAFLSNRLASSQNTSAEGAKQDSPALQRWVGVP